MQQVPFIVSILLCEFDCLGFEDLVGLLIKELEDQLSLLGESWYRVLETCSQLAAVLPPIAQIFHLAAPAWPGDLVVEGFGLIRFASAERDMDEHRIQSAECGFVAAVIVFCPVGNNFHMPFIILLVYLVDLASVSDSLELFKIPLECIAAAAYGAYALFIVKNIGTTLVFFSGFRPVLKILITILLTIFYHRIISFFC